MRIIKIAVDWRSSDEYLRLSKAIRDVIDGGKSLSEAAREHRVDVRMLASRVNEAKRVGLPSKPQGEKPQTRMSPPPRPPSADTGKGLAKDKPQIKPFYDFVMPHEWKPKHNLTREEVAEMLAKLPKQPDLPPFKAETIETLKKEATFNLKEWLKKRAAEISVPKLELSIVEEDDTHVTILTKIKGQDFNFVTIDKKSLPKDILILPKNQRDNAIFNMVNRDLGQFLTAPLSAIEQVSFNFATTIGPQNVGQLLASVENPIFVLGPVFRTALQEKMKPDIMELAFGITLFLLPAEEVYKAMKSGFKRAEELDRQISEPDDPRALARQKDAILDRYNKGEITRQQMETALGELA
jgi:hypothetical protein